MNTQTANKNNPLKPASRPETKPGPDSTLFPNTSIQLIYAHQYATYIEAGWLKDRKKMYGKIMLQQLEAFVITKWRDMDVPEDVTVYHFIDQNLAMAVEAYILAGKEVLPL